MMKKRKIHCIEMKENSNKDFTMKELSKMVGWIDYNEKNDLWDVTMSDGGGFTCKDQATAQIMASVEEVKAMCIECSCLKQMKGGLNKNE